MAIAYIMQEMGQWVQIVRLQSLPTKSNPSFLAVFEKIPRLKFTNISVVTSFKEHISQQTPLVCPALLCVCVCVCVEEDELANYWSVEWVSLWVIVEMYVSPTNQTIEKI